MTNLVASRFVVVIGAGLLAFAAGCQEQARIREYKVPRAETKKEPWHLLGAMIPREKQVWFFRLEGPPEQIAGLRDAFDSFVKSIRFADKAEDPISWTDLAKKGFQMVRTAGSRKGGTSNFATPPFESAPKTR